MHLSSKGAMAGDRVVVRQQYTKLSLVSHSMISGILLVGAEDVSMAAGATSGGVPSIYFINLQERKIDLTWFLQTI